MEVSDEMVEALLIHRYGKTRWEMTPEAMKIEPRKLARSELRSAIAVMPDQYRAGWLAGRDAAADRFWAALGCRSDQKFIRDGIRNMEPLA